MVKVLLIAALGFAGLDSGCSAQPADVPPKPADAPVPKPVDAPAPRPIEAAPAASGSDIKTADDLLTRLETADKDLKSLRAGLKYDKVFALAGDRQIRIGELVYVDTKERTPDGKAVPGSRKFAVDFQSLQVGTRIQNEEKDRKIVIFDGEWYVEKMPGLKQIVKRRVVKPGETFDPLKIGEGPFPVPIGQKKDDILKRFDVTLLPADKELEAPDPQGDNAAKELEELKAFVKDSHQLKLIPKAGLGVQDFQEIRLWYRPGAGGGGGVLLPRMARTVNLQGDVSIVRLINVKTNQEAPKEIMDVAVPPGWDAHIDDFMAPEGR